MAVCFFLACNYCRHCGTCISCMGRLPSPQRNNWLGMTHIPHAYSCKHSSTQRERHTQILIMSFNCLVTVFFLFSFFWSLRSSRSPALRFWQQSLPVCVQEVRGVRNKGFPSLLRHLVVWVCDCVKWQSSKASGIEDGVELSHGRLWPGVTESVLSFTAGGN